MEDLVINKIESCFKQIEKGTLPKDTNIGYCLNKLKTINVPMYEDYLQQYKNILIKIK